MNSLKMSVVVVSVVLLGGCGPKKEEAVSLPPEQILAGNAILAPQSVTLETQNVSLVNNAVVPAVVETNSLELTNPEMPNNPTSKDIQQALKNAGVYGGPIDGNIGPKSKKAIRDFQTQNGLSPDGKVGPRTWKKLAPHLQGVVAEPVEAMPIAN